MSIGVTRSREGREGERRTGLVQAANKCHFVDFLEREIAKRHAINAHYRPFSLTSSTSRNSTTTSATSPPTASYNAWVTESVSQQVRRDELLSRYGGEELGVVLPETTVESGALFAECICATVETMQFLIQF